MLISLKLCRAKFKVPRSSTGGKGRPFLIEISSLKAELEMREGYELRLMFGCWVFISAVRSNLQSSIIFKRLIGFVLYCEKNDLQPILIWKLTSPVFLSEYWINLQRW